MVVSGFAQIQAQLQYRASGCSMGLPVVVGTSRGSGGGPGSAASEKAGQQERKAGKCVKCAYRRRNSPPAASTPLRAGSASSMKNKMRARPPFCGLSGALFLGLKGGIAPKP